MTKAFPGCLANDHVDFTIGAGEIRALLGENGAGKSTLVKIIYGVLAADEGDIRWQGEAVTIASPNAARRLGIGMVFQHFSLFESLSVVENIALGLSGSEDMAALAARIRAVSENYGLPLDPSRNVHTLSVGERQRIEIVRCLLQNPKLLIMDEPTSVLTPQEADRLFETLRRLSSEGCSVLYISHKLEEIKALCHAATVMRGGRVVVEDCDPTKETAASMARMMIGEELSPPRAGGGNKRGGVRLSATGLTVVSDEHFGVDLANISFAVTGGEIFGIAGIAGNGQAEFLAALSGEAPVKDANAITIEDTPAGTLNARQRRGLGLCFVPEERLGQGAVPELTLVENAFLDAYRRLRLTQWGLMKAAPSRAFAEDIKQSFDVRAPGVRSTAGSLSGGNLQKFIVGREILQAPEVLIVAQPTWGVDAGAAAAIHTALLDLAAKGTAILVVSQDLDELMAISDRIAVLSEGRLSAARPAGEMTVEGIGLLMGGLHDLLPEGAGGHAA